MPNSMYNPQNNDFELGLYPHPGRNILVCIISETCFYAWSNWFDNVVGSSSKHY
jgi:hypothetical protein